MRRIVRAATVALVVLLTLAGAASAADLPSSRGPDGRPPGDEGRSMSPQPRAHFVTLGARLAGGAVVNGHVYDFYGAAVSGASMYWDAPYGETWEWGEATTDGAGAYSFSGLPAAAGQGYVSARYSTDPWSWAARSSASWADPGPTTFDWRPGGIPTSITRGTVWPGWDYATAYLYGNDALSDLSAGSDIWGSGDLVTGDAFATPGAYESGAVYFWMDQGIEFATTATVTAGAVSGQSISVT